MNSEPANRIKGVLFGEALGDAVGVGTEFTSKFDATLKFTDGLQYFKPWYYRDDPNAPTGEWSDDTAQFLCILEAYLQQGDLTSTGVAAQFIHWAETDGRGMGNHTRKVLLHPKYAQDPIGVSKSVWKSSGSASAPNGAVMRTAAIALLRPDDLDWTEQTAVMVAQTTHYDPRCVASSVALTITIAALISRLPENATQENQQEWEEKYLEAIHEGVTRGSRYHPDVATWATKSLSDLELDGEGGGYTYKCMGSAFWALREFYRREIEMYDDLYEDRFEDILKTIVSEGGDADTNGAVTAAALGAVVGFSNLPKHLVEGLKDKNVLEAYQERLMTRQD